MGPPRRGGSTQELDRWLLSPAISTIPDVRRDACSRKGENDVPQGAVRPDIYPHPEIACSLPWAMMLPHQARRAFSLHPFQRLLFSFQLPLFSAKNLSRC